MAALDFPSSPTNGQQYSAPNGALYTYDGTAWTVSGVLSTGSAAGGSLAGTYPNPTVAASAIRGTPSSGGTARELAKASIWGGDDLLDLSVPTAKLAVRAATRGGVAAAFPANWNSATTGSWLTVLTLPTLTTRGGAVLISAVVGALILGNATQGTLYCGIYRGVTLAQSWRYDISVAATSARFPFPPFVYFDQPAAGSYAYSFQVLQGSANAALYVAADNTGTMAAMELA